MLNGAAHLTTPKTDATLRSVTMFAESVAALAAHRKRQSERRLAAGTAWQDKDKANAVPNVAEAARLPQFHIHDLRHTHATHLLMDGWPVAIVSRRLGHATPAITLQRYAYAIAGVDGEDVAIPVALALTSTDSFQ